MRPLTIAVVNNLPPAAARSANRQFGDVLRMAAEDAVQFQLRWFTADGTGSGEPIAALWDAAVDGLIVTGMEPMAQALWQEPAWPLLCQLAVWARRNTHAVIWSCLAAHAVALFQDGIDRVRLPRKLSGVYETRRMSPHPMIAGLPDAWRAPHSRLNDLPSDKLRDAGYLVLSEAPRAGVDMAVRMSGRSLFVLMQSHPEYDAGALSREYRRDRGRFVAGETSVCPWIPEAYFDDATARALDGAATLPTTLPVPENTWQQPAVRVFRNWLDYIAGAQRARLPLVEAAQ